jgi:BirA family biotin operon repressor/biotin-[acetyl-CoA-carboxylase] ligase
MRNRIIHFLKKNNGFVSGEELSKTLNVSRAAVWKCIEELRADGYEIAAVSRNGYRLTSSPDKLLAEEVQFGLGTKKFGCEVQHFDSVGSTMDEAFRLGMEGAAEGTVVVAETQTKGRGRMGRAWASSKGKGIYFSIVLRPTCSAADAARLTLVAAVAVSEATEKVTGLQPRIKWPNDLLLNDKKVCGILTELRAEVDRAQFVIVGFGLNVNNTAAQLLPEAISLREVKGDAVSRVALLQEILRSFEARYLAIAREGYGPAFKEWRLRSATLGRRVRFVERQKTLEGIAVDLAEDGGLVVEFPTGELVKRMAGDILL